MMQNGMMGNGMMWGMGLVRFSSSFCWCSALPHWPNTYSDKSSEHTRRIRPLLGLKLQQL
jgi:hypothetical protein